MTELSVPVCGILQFDSPSRMHRCLTRYRALDSLKITRMVRRMLQDAESRSRSGLLLLIGLNMIPLVGVLNWGWQTFDLIFLYWMENLVIGVFTLARMVVRPYGHGIELILPLFLAPFFAVHYGGFCWGHGTFVVSMFRPEDSIGFQLVPTVMTVLSSPTMLTALAALAFIQALDWIRDARARGFGADSLMLLMVMPYRRIVVLHLTILGGGFALMALNEPVMGLAVLVLVKTGSDIWHWKKDAELEKHQEMLELTPEMIAEMKEKYPRPVVTVNGREQEYGTFAEMKNSKEFRIATALMRVMGASNELKVLGSYLDMKIAEENQREPGRRLTTLDETTSPAS